MSETGFALQEDDLLIGIERAEGRGMITLRGDLADAKLGAAVKEVAGVSVPQALSAHFEGDRGAVWMAPDELLLFVPGGQVADALNGLSAALSGVRHLALDMSDARAVFELTGPLVGEILAKGAPIDLSDKGFPVGTARRTHLAGLAVAVWRRDAEHWEIVALRSFAHHLQAWLEQAAVPGSEIGI